MADNTIDTLSIEIQSNASGASRSIDDLCNKLDRLNRITLSGAGNLSNYSRQLQSFNRTAQQLNHLNFNNLRLPNLSNSFRNIGNIGSLSQRAASQVQNLSKSFSNIGNSAKKGSSGLSELWTNLKKILALKFSFSSLKSSIEKSMNLLEDYNYFQAAFNQVASKAGDNWKEAGYNSAEEYAESFSKRARELTSKMSGFDVSDVGTLTANKSGKSLGMDPSLLLNYQATFAQISSSMGNTSEQAEKLSKALTMIGADLASVKNMDFKTVYENMSSGLVGMSRAVDKYGANIRVANLQQMATNLGIQTSVSKMDQASKAMLRTIVILDSTRYAWADMANTINMPANQLRILQSNLVACARALGNIFLPIVAKVLPYINGLVIAFQRLLTYIGGLLGVNDKIGSMFSGVGGGSDNLSDTLDSLDDTDLSGIEDATDDTNSNLSDAVKNAKKLKQFLASYDELEVMSKDNSLSDLASSKIKTPALDTSALDSGILNAALDKLLDEYQKKWDAAYNSMENKAMVFANKVTDAFKKLAKAAEPTTKALKNLWNNGLKQFKNFTWTALKDFWKHFLVPLGKWTLGEKGLPRLVNAFNDFLVKINWDKINASLRKLWDVLEPFAENVGTGLLDFFDDFFDKAADGANKLPDLIYKITSAIEKISSDQAQDIGYKLGQFFTVLGSIKLLKSSIGILDKLGVGKFLSMLASHPLIALSVGLGAILLKLDSMGKIHIPWESINNGFGTLREKIMDLVEKIPWDDLGEMFNSFIETITPIGEGIILGIGDVIKGIASAFKILYEKIQGMSTDELERLGKAIGTIIGIKITADLAGKITGLGNAYSTLGTGLGVLKTGILGLTALAGFKGGEWLSKNVFGSDDSWSLGDLANDIMGYQPGDVAGALESWADDVISKIHPNKLSEDDIKLFDDWSEAVLKMVRSGEITGEQGQSLNKYIDSIESGSEKGKIALWDLQNKMMDMGISFDSFNQYLDGTKKTLDSVGDSTKTAAEKIEENSKLIDSVSFSNIEDNLNNLKKTADKVDYAELVVKTANAIDEMGGIWENGKQILGEKALQIYQEISKGLEPDENGFYKIGENQMVQFGNGITDYKETLKSKTKDTLDESLQHVLTWGIPSAYTLGQGEAGYYIEGFNSSIVSLSPDMQATFNAMYDGISTQDIKDKAEANGKEIGTQSGKGFKSGIEESTDDAVAATKDMMEKSKDGAADSMEVHSPSKWFEELAKFCGRGFREGLDTGFASAFHWFGKLSVRINNSIGSLHNIGWNAIIGMNNGMVEAASQHLYKNAQSIAQNVANIFRKTLKIHSPSQVMMELGGFTMEGFRIGMQNMIPELQSTIGDISTSIQDIQLPQMEANIKPVPTARMNQRPVSATGTFGDDIRREVIAISNNTFDNNQNIAQVIREAVRGMAVYADGHIIGYLQEENQQFRNRNGFGLFEG